MSDSGTQPDDMDVKVAQLLSILGDVGQDIAVAALTVCGGNVEEAAELFTNVTPQNEQKPVVTESRQGRNRPKRGEQYFVGGGDSSGQAVVAPTSQGATPDAHALLQDVFAKVSENALAQGEAALNFGGPGESVRSVQPFSGVGRRLGHTEGESRPIAPTLLPHRIVETTVYRNGYRVDNGPLLDLETPDGTHFFEALQRGVVPREIAQLHPNTDITVRLVDRSGEDFVPPAYVAFQGSGHRLDDPNQRNEAAPVGEPGYRSGTDAFELRESEETCKVSIVCFAGKRHEFVVNPLRHTVKDLYYLAATKVQGGAKNFELVARDFPPRPLRDLTATIDAARLRNSSILMKKLA